MSRAYQLPLPMIYPDYVEYRYLDLWLRGTQASYANLVRSLCEYYRQPRLFA